MASFSTRFRSRTIHSRAYGSPIRERSRSSSTDRNAVYLGPGPGPGCSSLSAGLYVQEVGQGQPRFIEKTRMHGIRSLRSLLAVVSSITVLVIFAHLW